jgi:ribosomal protein S18 acetylase RimI-like enzyme
MHDVIDETFGWDESFQKKGFYENYSLDWLSWVYRNNHKVGLICARKASESLHLHLLIVFEQYQRTGIAAVILSDLIGKERTVTLSSFKNNLPAIRLYQKMGFQCISEDEHFYSYKADNYGNP